MLRVTIETNNAAFDDDAICDGFGCECARLLRFAADRIESTGNPRVHGDEAFTDAHAAYSFPLHDAHGNRVGLVEATDE